MRLLIIFAFIALCITPVLAAPVDSTGGDVSTPAITEFTIIEGSGWSSGSSHNQSLSCDVAHQRALRQLNNGIAVARLHQIVTAAELTNAIIKPAQQAWNDTEGRCFVHLQLNVPRLPSTRPITMIGDRLF